MHEATMKLKVLEKNILSPRVVGLKLGFEDQVQSLPQWEAGAHIQLSLNVNGEEYLRQYSLCGKQQHSYQWDIAILKEQNGRGGSQYIHEQISVNDQIEVSLPRNHFKFSGGSKCVFIAGGIGITPIIAMVREAIERQLDWRLVYLAQNDSDFIFKEELEQIDQTGRIVFHTSDEKGFFDLDGFLKQFKEDTTVYSCGPQGLLDVLEKIKQKNTWKLVLERFAVEVSEEITTGKSFDVTLQKTGKRIHVLETESILDALKREGIKVPCSCQSGTCGTCETVVISGIPEHRDFILSEEERDLNETMMICVSRAVSSELVLDL